MRFLLTTPRVAIDKIAIVEIVPTGLLSPVFGFVVLLSSLFVLPVKGSSLIVNSAVTVTEL